LRLNPVHAEALNNLGSVLHLLGQLTETVDALEQAVRVNPSRAEGYSNLGSAQHMHGDWDEAMASFQKGLALNPDMAELHYNYGLLLLAQGRLAEGWPEFAWRLQSRGYPVRYRDAPLWDGGPLDGRTLLVHAEQGFGDTLQFIRYLKLVRGGGGPVFFETHAQLLPLLTASGFEGLVVDTALPQVDLYAPVLSLPGLCGTTLETIPADVPYLAADPALVEAWRGEIAALPGFKIGIAWQGNPTYGYDHYRSIPLAQFKPLSAVDGVTIVSLQKGAGSEQLATAEWPIHDLAPRLDGQRGAFMDTAAVMQHLDLVITSDTATAHLAGGLGVPVWVALSAFADWRWFSDRSDSPWYPTMRLYRQSRLGDWPGVFSRMVSELKGHVNS
jgi:hypothetical protein